MRIGMLGDSITALGTQWRYKMDQHRPELDFVGSYGTDPYKHDGVAGDTSRGALQRIDSVPACDKLMILIGTNDPMFGIYYTETGANIQRIVDEAIARGMQPYVCTILPRCDNALYNQATAVNNYWIKSTVKRCTFLDTAWALIASGLSQEVLFVDCLHLSKWGQNVVAEYCSPRL